MLFTTIRVLLCLLLNNVLIMRLQICNLLLCFYLFFKYYIRIPVLVFLWK
jgi:hypothetical protein